MEAGSRVGPPVLSLGATGLGGASSRRGVWGASHAQRDDILWLSPSSRPCPTQARHLGSSLHPASSPAASGHPPAPHRSPSPPQHVSTPFSTLSVFSLTQSSGGCRSHTLRSPSESQRGGPWCQVPHAGRASSALQEGPRASSGRPASRGGCPEAPQPPPGSHTPACLQPVGT